MIKIMIGIIMIFTDINISTTGGMPLKNLWWFSFVTRPTDMDILPDFLGFLLIFLGIKQLAMLVYPNKRLAKILQHMCLFSGLLALVDFILRLVFASSLAFGVYKLIAFFVFLTFLGVLAGLVLFFKEIQKATTARMRYLEFGFTVAIFACLYLVMGLNVYGERFVLTLIVSICFVLDIVYMAYLLFKNHEEISLLER